MLRPTQRLLASHSKCPFNMLGKPPAGVEPLAESSSPTPASTPIIQPFQYKLRPQPDTYTLLHRRVTWNECPVTTYVKDPVSGNLVKKEWLPYTFKTIEDRDASNLLLNLDSLTDPTAIPYSQYIRPAESTSVPYISQGTKHLQVKPSDLGNTPEESQWEDKLAELAMEDLSEEETNLKARNEEEQAMFDSIELGDSTTNRNFDIGDELSRIQEAVRKEFEARNRLATKGAVLVKTDLVVKKGKGVKTSKVRSKPQTKKMVRDSKAEEEEIQREVKERIMNQLNKFLKRTLNV